MMTITLNEGKRSLKRILHYTRCTMTDKMLHTMTESRLNDLALMAHYMRKSLKCLCKPIPEKLKFKRVVEYVYGVNSI